MSEEDQKRLLTALTNGLVCLVSSKFSLSTFVCPECGSKILVDKSSSPFCLKCYKIMEVSNG